MKESVSCLLVDNREQVRRSVVKAVRAERRLQSCEQVESGYEAIAKALRNPPDVVLMSAGIETRLSGIYVCKEISASLPDTKVILYGEDSTDETIHKVFQMGAVNYLVYPCPARDLIEAVLATADGRSAIHHSAAGALRKEFKRVLDLQDNLVYVLNVVIRLTPAELNILKLLYNGMHYSEVTKVLFIGTSTMKTHISHILKKFNLSAMSQVLEVLRSTELFSLINMSQTDA